MLHPQNWATYNVVLCMYIWFGLQEVLGNDVIFFFLFLLVRPHIRGIHPSYIELYEAPKVLGPQVLHRFSIKWIRCVALPCWLLLPYSVDMWKRSEFCSKPSRKFSGPTHIEHLARCWGVEETLTRAPGLTTFMSFQRLLSSLLTNMWPKVDI